MFPVHLSLLNWFCCWLRKINNGQRFFLLFFFFLCWILVFIIKSFHSLIRNPFSIKFFALNSKMKRGKKPLRSVFIYLLFHFFLSSSFFSVVFDWKYVSDETHLIKFSESRQMKNTLVNVILCKHTSINNKSIKDLGLYWVFLNFFFFYLRGEAFHLYLSLVIIIIIWRLCLFRFALCMLGDVPWKFLFWFRHIERFGTEIDIRPR